MSDQMKFSVETGSEGGLNIDVVDAKLTEEYLVLSVKFDNKKEGRVADLRVLKTAKLREMLNELDKGKA